MAKIFLSIGLPKTGTTAIQSFLRENEGLLNRHGYSFPDLYHKTGNKYKNRNGHFLLFNSNDPDKEEAMVHNEIFQKLEKTAKVYPYIILSDEALWKIGSKRKGFWKKTASRFKEIDCELCVIVYLRRQDLLVQSLWNQNIKSNLMNWTKKFDEYIAQNGFSYFPLDYHKELTKISKHTGQDNLIIRVYEHGQFEGEENSIFSDFLKCIGLKMSSQYTKETVKSNPGLRDNFIEIKRVVNGIPEYREMHDFMSTPVKLASNCLDGDPLHADTSMFSYKEQKKFLEQFEESNRKVAKEFLNRPDGRLFYEPVQEIPQWEINPDVMYRDIILFFTEALCRQEKKIIDLQEEIKALNNSKIFRIYRKISKEKNPE